MITIKQPSPKRHGEFEMLTPPTRSWFDVFATKYGIFLASLAASAALIAFAAWTLLFYTPNSELAPTLTSTASLGGDAEQSAADEDSASLFAPTETQTELIIRPPTLESSVADTPDRSVSSSPTTPAEADNPIRPSPSQVDGSLATIAPLPLERTAASSSVTRSNKRKEKLVASPPRSRIDAETNKSLAARTPTQRSNLNQDLPLTLQPDTLTPAVSTDAAESDISVDLSNKLADISDPATSTYAETPVNMNSVPQEFTPISAVASELEPKQTNAVVQNSGIAIIVNKENKKSLTRTDIGNIYRDRITRWPSGNRILVLNLPPDSSQRHQFSTAVLEMSPTDAATELSNRTIMNRLQNVYRTKTARAIVSYVERDVNAIGYVPANALTEDDRVRVVLRIP